MLNSVSAQDESPPRICGDGITQSPNDNGQFEKCDTAGETDECTAQCGAKLIGWAWAHNGGLISMNSDNCQAPFLPSGITCAPQTVDYYVQVDAANRLRGYGWSDNLGWVCFGEQCSTGSICEFASGPCDPNAFGTAQPSGGWAADVQLDGTEDPPITGWAKVLSLGDQGAISLNCSADGTGCAFDYEVEYVSRNFNGAIRPTLNFLSWNNNSENHGVGTIWNDAPISQIPPWLQTRYGDIYARGGLTGAAPPPGFNSTYRILSDGGIINFQSTQGLDPVYYDPEFGAIDFPTPSTRFSNILGELSIDDYLCEVSDNPYDEECINSFGDTVRYAGTTNDIDNLLGGNIFHYPDGGFFLVGGKTFLNGDGFEDGSGTIVVDGSLWITANIQYENASNLERFRNLASVVWIVRGDLYIAPTVTELAGNFIVLGNGTAECNSNPDRLDGGNVFGCGQISTCYSFFGTGDCTNRLTVNGMMIGRKFYFEREFAPGDTEVQTQGSEIIIYDGRLLANTPPGTEDFAQSLPIWRPGTFSE